MSFKEINELRVKDFYKIFNLYMDTYSYQDEDSEDIEENASQSDIDKFYL